jgi:hypothetical protein
MIACGCARVSNDYTAWLGMTPIKSRKKFFKLLNDVLDKLSQIGVIFLLPP